MVHIIGVGLPLRQSFRRGYLPGSSRLQALIRMEKESGVNASRCPSSFHPFGQLSNYLKSLPDQAVLFLRDWLTCF